MTFKEIMMAVLGGGIVSGVLPFAVIGAVDGLPLPLQCAFWAAATAFVVWNAVQSVKELS